MQWTLATIVAMELAGAAVPAGEPATYHYGIYAPRQAPLSASFAASLSGWTPVAAAGLAGLTSRHPVVAFGAAIPGFGAGHVYAGDPGRGAWIMLGGALMLGLAGGLGYYYDTRPIDCPLGGCMQPIDKTMWYPVVATVVYSLWASADARATAERRNLELTGWHAPQSAPVER